MYQVQFHLKWLVINHYWTVTSRQFRDRHLFSLLCWRNFAHLPEMTFIESVQRVTSYGHRQGHSKVNPWDLRSYKWFFIVTQNWNDRIKKHRSNKWKEIYRFGKQVKERTAVWKWCFMVYHEIVHTWQKFHRYSSDEEIFMEGSVLILTSFDPGILGPRYLYLKFYFIRRRIEN